jgi:DNA-binding response OmpR family regulator
LTDVEAPARIWVIGSDHWPRAYLRAELIERGYDAIGYAAIRDALAELAMFPSRRPRVVVLDLHDRIGDEKAVEALLRHGAPVIALAGAAEAAEDLLHAHRWAALLRRPLTIGAIVEAVGQACGWEPT